MPKKRNLDPVWGWMYFLFGMAGALDISLEHPYDGFFLRDSYSKNDPADPGSVAKTFVINQPSNLYKINLQNGPFESQQTLSRELLDAVYARTRKNSSLMHRSIIYDMDVSAHIVSKDISPKVPRLQVLVHASPNKKVQVQASVGQKQSSWCAQVFVEANGVEYNAVCILSEKEQVCVAGLDLPSDWWTVNGTYARVSYSFTGIDQSSKCASASNNLIPVRNETAGFLKQEISVLHLKMDEKSFDEWKDQDILIDVPREMFHNSDTFEIPIRLEKNSDLQVFLMRAKIRQGLRITGARMTDPSSQWSIHVDIKEHQKVGTVTAFVRDKSVYEKSPNVQDVFRWQMEVVEEGYDFRDTGRLVWSIEYQRDGVAAETYTAQESKIVSQINIRSKDQKRLVPVLKVTEIVNVAVLTGRVQEYPLQVYAVDDTDKFSEVTQQTKCHSVEVDVLKVASDCTSLYVDGAESRGSHNVTIIAKSGHTTAFVDIAVWVPEERPELELSDFKLERVRNWKVYREELGSKQPGNPLLDDSLNSLGGDDDDADYQVSRKCELQRQQSTVEVYTRFYIQTPKETDFFLGAGAFLKVTDLVKTRLRMSDDRVAALNGNMIRGMEEGRTEIQLLSPRNGHVLAVREMIVSHEKVNVAGLDLKLVTGTGLFVEPSINLDGALVAMAFLDQQFLNNNQEGVIDVEIHYSDGTSMPLHHITPEDYFLEVKTTNMNVIGVVASPTSHQPHVVATGEGHAELSVLLKLSKACERKRSRILGNNTLDIHVDFSQERQIYDNSRFQNDARFDSNTANKLYQAAQSQKLYGQHLGPRGRDEGPAGEKGKAGKKGSVGVLQLNSDFEDAYVQDEEDGMLQEPLMEGTRAGMSPMQVGMYVLLAVFCVALSVFMVNCVVFFVRYKRKQRPKKAAHEAIKNANDWVWIGRATLERNSVYTRSSRTLMPEEDFNGNVNSTRPLSTSSAGSSTSSTNGVPSGQNSNRNSTVSTYKGSECSIRITANPLTEDGAGSGAGSAAGAGAGAGQGPVPGAQNGPLPEEVNSEGGVAQWDYEAMGMNYNQLLDYFDNLKETNA